MVAKALLTNDMSGPAAIAAAVARGLAHAQAKDGEIVVQTPIAFPSGRLVAIKIIGGPDVYTVSDDGAAMQEADLLGILQGGRREARKVAQSQDITFNEWELFESGIPADRLVGYAAIIANAAAMVMIRTADRFADTFSMQSRDDLVVRLTRIFGIRNVARNVDVIGSSAKSWNFDASVTLQSGRPGLFSIVTPSPTSIAFAYAKFDDVSRSDAAPFLGAVLDGDFQPTDKSLLTRVVRRTFLTSDSDEAFLTAA